MLLPAFFRANAQTPKLNVLVLGGTNFLGPAIVNALVEKNHQVTLFNRGITNPSLFPLLSKIRGDRENGIDGYQDLLNENRIWDVVIDVWPENPNFVEEAARVLRSRTRHYMFVSSTAVYRDYRELGITEEAALRESEVFEEGNYNANKVLCEQIVAQNFGSNFTIVRPGAIVGDRDPGPFGTYLLDRIVNRSQILAPDSNDPVQFVDAADVGRFLTQCGEQNISGVYNLVGPAETLGYKDMLNNIRNTLNSNVEIIWIHPEFLANTARLEPFLDIPFWIPLETDPEPGFYQVSNAKAVQFGLHFTDLSETVRISYDSVEQNRFIPESDTDSAFGISNDREDEIISLWTNRTTNENPTISQA